MDELRAFCSRRLLLGVTASAQPPLDDRPPANRRRLGWNFDEEESRPRRRCSSSRASKRLDIGVVRRVRGARDGELPAQERAAASTSRSSSRCVYMGRMKAYMLSVVNVFGLLGGVCRPRASASRAEKPATAAADRRRTEEQPAAVRLQPRVVHVRRASPSSRRSSGAASIAGAICAFGALTQLIDAVVPETVPDQIPASSRRGPATSNTASCPARSALYFVTTRDHVLSAHIEPFWLFTFDATPVLWVMVGVLLVASIFVRNLYCRFLCPLGAALGAHRRRRRRCCQIKRWSECSQCALCEKTCEWGRDPQAANHEGARCVRCERLRDPLRRQAALPHWLLELKRKARAAL